MGTAKYEIIVVGGGFSGAAAAVVAARQGLRVLLVEKYNCLGGAASYSLVNPFMPHWTRDPENGNRIDLSCGLFSEITEMLNQAGGLRQDDRCCFNEEILKYVLNRIAVRSGVHLLFQSCVTAVGRKGNSILSVDVSSVSGTETLSADYFVDATGDANLAFLAGCPFDLGREEDHLCQPMTLCFRLGNVHMPDKGRTMKRVNCLYQDRQARGEIRNPREDVLVFPTTSSGIYHFNATRVVRLDPTNVWDVTEAELEGREQVIELWSFLRKNFEEFRDSVLLSTGIQIGVRESRRVRGLHTLTKEELLACTRFPDAVAVCNYDIDIHNPDGSGTSHYYFSPGAYYTIPYRCMIPKETDNLLVTGRCISTTHEAQASIRTMPTCCTLGQAAGTAAALAFESGTTMKDIAVRSLQERLTAAGARLN